MVLFRIFCFMALFIFGNLKKKLYNIEKENKMLPSHKALTIYNPSFRKVSDGTD